MIRRMIIVIAALAVVFGGIFGWKAFQGYQVARYRASMKPPAVTVSSTVARREQWQPKISAVGGLSAIQGVEVSSEVPGKVGSINFESGHQVEKGALLVQLDASAELGQLRAVKAELALKRLDYERAKGLVRSAAVSQAQLDRAKSEMESMEGKVAEQRALVAKKSIRAPFAGSLGIRRVNVGEFVSPGTEIVTLQSLDPIYVDFTLPEKHLNDLAIGQGVEVEVGAYPKEIFLGAVNAVSPKVEATTRNVRVQATLGNAALRLRPGMFARVSVLVAGASSVVTVPRTVVTFYPYGDSVFLIDEKDSTLTVERRQVETGRIREGRVEIVQGLKAGDLVVNTGQLKLRSGQRVRIDNSVVLGGVASTP